MTAARLGGLVLAGGASTRMGMDKATLRFGGVRLVDGAVALLRTICDDVVVAAGSRVLDEVAVPQIPDVAGEGPLAGIVAGLRHAGQGLVAVVAVDMPWASAAVLEALAARWDGEPAVVPVVGDIPQPLHTVYAAAAAPQLAALLAKGERSPQRALRTLGARYVGADVWSACDPEGAFATNVNVPDDLRHLGLSEGPHESR